MSFDPLVRLGLTTQNVKRFGGKSCVKQFPDQSTGGSIFGDDDVNSNCDTVSFSGDRFAYSKRGQSSGDILSHRSDNCSEEGSRLRVGRKPIEAPGATDDTENHVPQDIILTSERFENTQRNRNAGDIIGLTDGQAPAEQVRQRAKVEPPTPVQQDESVIRVGRQRVEPPTAIQNASKNATSTNSPWATDYTPVEEPKKVERHSNHFDHHDGLLTGGSMQRSGERKPKVPLWY
eukprot:TRINITY_DN22584_c0_g1_i1.p1 TRINITY_DN22584_c0_g1~~TRINITY_DN22584_c0_g1_i1.p1  ORF type:complete len:233 (+),score=36.71 TRINITY_DN22584_c0_g1_i1:44-742(+)